MNTPGQQASAPLAFPEDAGVLHEDGRPHVIVFVHRQCPCSRATLDQLLSVEGLYQRTVVFVGSEGKDTRIGRQLEQLAKRYADHVIEDPANRIAGHFGAKTSGHVVIFSAEGRLAYAGGVTPGRGMTGPSGGGLVLRELLLGLTPRHTELPVFGCPLHESNLSETHQALPACCEKPRSDAPVFNGAIGEQRP